MNKTYIAIDLKSFYASCECVARKLDPLKTNLVVADVSRTEKTICLAVSPSLKQYGIPGRARLFEVLEAVKKINRERLKKAPLGRFTGKSYNDDELKANPNLELTFIAATPHMRRYMSVSSDIYQIYLKTIAPEDIHVYSVDECFMDITAYMKSLNMDAHALTRKLIKEVYEATGITATGGIGTNMYLCKVAMDIMAKHSPADKDGVRIAELDEESYRKNLWDHQPLRDFWRVGPGLIRRLEKHGLYTMGDICRQSIENEEVLYREFGVNAELLIDHAWGYEPTTIADIKSYKPDNNSLSNGQVLDAPYDYEHGKLIVKEMADVLSMQLVEKGLLTDQISLAIGYDKIDLENYVGELKNDYIGKRMIKPSTGSVNFGRFTSSTKLIVEFTTKLYEKIMNPELHMRRVYLVATHAVREEDVGEVTPAYEQLSLFEDVEKKMQREKAIDANLKSEKSLQKALLKIQNTYGKNAVVKGMNLKEGAKTISRNKQVGGHRE